MGQTRLFTATAKKWYQVLQLSIFPASFAPLKINGVRRSQNKWGQNKWGQTREIKGSEIKGSKSRGQTRLIKGKSLLKINLI
ncbi:MAG: hypothetical protein CTY18_05290 [Methylomonas sp.]|nr:MAG: hypothetical protein CTY18_05290 [Methylomonas sp.]